MHFSETEFDKYFEILRKDDPGLILHAIRPECDLEFPWTGRPSISSFYQNSEEAGIFANEYNDNGFNICLGTYRYYLKGRFYAKTEPFTEWLFVRVNTDLKRFENGEAMMHLEKMNRHEFGGTATIIRERNNYWMLVPVRKIEPEQDRALVDHYYRIYLLALAIKWNVVIGNILGLEVNTEICNPGIVIPAAGTLYYDQGTTVPVQLLSSGGVDDQKKILSEILKSRKTYFKSGTIENGRTKVQIDRYISSMSINEDFDYESALEYINRRRREPLGFKTRYVSNVTSQKKVLDLIIMLRANFKSSPSVIDRIARSTVDGEKTTRYIKDIQHFLHGRIYTADLFISKIRGNCISDGTSPEQPHFITVNNHCLTPCIWNKPVEIYQLIDFSRAPAIVFEQEIHLSIPDAIPEP